MRELFERYCADSTSVEANVAAAVVRATAATAGADEIDTIIERFQHGDTPQEELRFLYALAEVRDPDQMARVLELAMTPAVRTQNAPFLIGSCIANRDNGADGLEARARALGRDERAVPVQQHRAHARPASAR